MTEKQASDFLKAIAERSQQELQQLTDGEDERRAAVERAACEQAAAQAQSWLRGQIARAQTEAALQVEAQKAADRRSLLEFREQCARESFEQAQARIAAFTQSPDYPAHLAALLKRALDALGRAEPAVVYLRREDMAFADNLRAAEPGASLRFEPDGFSLGGLRCYVPSLGRRADLSFDTALRELRGRFAELSGLTVE